MNAALKRTCDALVQEFHLIPEERRHLLEKLSAYIQQKVQLGKEVHLVYVCTHNSRRSHFGQIWAKAAAGYFGIPRVYTYSGGTEATAFHPNAIKAAERAGFRIVRNDDSSNPKYDVFTDDAEQPSVCFSKVYHHEANPAKDFAAVMTCSDAEENCPFIPGVELRIATTYHDPKQSDGTAQQDETYLERCLQIGRECLYVFSKVK